jgi:hypothetical protein
MKSLFGLVLILTLSISCTENKAKVDSKNPMPIAGTWKLITGTLIDKKDTTITDYTKNTAFIKVINEDHFAFLQHDLSKPKDSIGAFSAGGGHYSLSDSLYTEHLEYCSDRQWEGNDFSFVITITNDTLVQRGIEKVESAGVNRINIEKYVRIK